VNDRNGFGKALRPASGEDFGGAIVFMDGFEPGTVNDEKFCA
jgi:hypothetical protein